jgi:hypothetical protein
MIREGSAFQIYCYVTIETVLILSGFKLKLEENGAFVL